MSEEGRKEGRKEERKEGRKREKEREKKELKLYTLRIEDIPEDYESILIEEGIGICGGGGRRRRRRRRRDRKGIDVAVVITGKGASNQIQRLIKLYLRFFSLHSTHQVQCILG